MEKISFSVPAGRKPFLPCLAAILSISLMVLAAACAQTFTSGDPSKGSAIPGISTTAIGRPPATQASDKTSLPVQAGGQSGSGVARPLPKLPGAIQRIEPTSWTPVTGEVPASLLGEIRSDLARRLKVETGKIEVVRSESVLWNDGSLGCPKPGEFYTQALVNGYWLILAVDGINYDYRASDQGNYFLCERPAPLAPATSRPVINDPGKQPIEP